MKISVESLSLPCSGQRVNGDAVVVRELSDGLLVAVVDALGHGPTAAEIAGQAVENLSGAAISDGVLGLMHDLNDALHGTRGAAAMVVLLRGGEIEGCGVGNVEMRSLGSAVPVVQSPGILGVRVRRYNVFRAGLTGGARLLIFSDGISAGIALGELRDLSATEACRTVVQRYRRAHDDATILVADVKD